MSTEEDSTEIAYSGDCVSFEGDMEGEDKVQHTAMKGKVLVLLGVVVFVFILSMLLFLVMFQLGNKEDDFHNNSERTGVRLDFEVGYPGNVGKKGKKNEEIKPIFYNCNGHCLTNSNPLRPETQKAAEEFGCEDLKVERRVKVIPGVRNGIEPDELAVKIFQDNELFMFCMTNSVYDYTVDVESSDGKKKFDKVEKRINLCQSGDRVGETEEHENIQCKKV